MWEKQDRDKSSTWRELKTVAQIIFSLSKMIYRVNVEKYPAPAN
jgi:hypothetical protein